MIKKDHFLMKFLTGVLFLIPVILGLNNYFSREYWADMFKYSLNLYDIRQILYPISFILLAVSIFTKKRSLFAISAILAAIWPFLNIISFFSVHTGPLKLKQSLAMASYFLQIAAWGMLFISVLNNPVKKKRHIIAAGLFAANILLELVRLLPYYPIYYLLKAAVSIAIFLSFFMWEDTEAPFKSSKLPASAVTMTSNTAPISNVEKLTKLKELLDMGVITPEEFSEKKKDLLNL